MKIQAPIKCFKGAFNPNRLSETRARRFLFCVGLDEWIHSRDLSNFELEEALFVPDLDEDNGMLCHNGEERDET